MAENKKINGWTFEETIKTTKNLMEVENNVFKWDVLRHLRDFAENFKNELEQYQAIGTVEEFKALKEKNEPKKPKMITRCGELIKFYPCPNCSTSENYVPVYPKQKHCVECGQALDWSEGE